MFCNQAKSSANSACRNIAEGFWRGELLDSTDEALEKRYFERSEYEMFNEAINHALATAIELHEYLRNTLTPGGD